MESEGASASNAETVSATETADTEKNLTAAPDETLTSETGAADETVDDSSDEMEITIVLMTKMRHLLVLPIHHHQRSGVQTLLRQ